MQTQLEPEILRCNDTSSTLIGCTLASPPTDQGLSLLKRNLLRFQSIREHQAAQIPLQKQEADYSAEHSG